MRFLSRAWLRQWLGERLGRALCRQLKCRRPGAADPRLRAAEERFRKIASLSANGVILADDAGFILYANEAADRLFGLSPTEGHFLEELMPPAYREEHRAAFARVTSGGRPSHLMGVWIEMEGQHSSGRTFPVELVLGDWRDEEGRLYFLGVVRDISDRRLAEAALKEANRELERSNADLRQFAGVASHDLKAPLRQAAVLADCLRERVQPLDPESARLAAAVANAVRRMQGLVDRVLAYARAAAPAGQAAARVPLAPLLRRAAEAAEPWRRPGDSLNVGVPEGMALRGDAVQFEQLFGNLLANAFKFRNPGEPANVQVTARPDHSHAGPRGPYARVEVADDGVGVDPAQRGRLFQLFQRLHPESRYPGHGMGLAICRRVADRHGGEVGVDSAGPGRGSIFHAVLPLWEGPEGGGPANG